MILKQEPLDFIILLLYVATSLTHSFTGSVTQWNIISFYYLKRTEKVEEEEEEEGGHEGKS